MYNAVLCKQIIIKSIIHRDSICSVMRQIIAYTIINKMLKCYKAMQHSLSM